MIVDEGENLNDCIAWNLNFKYGPGWSHVLCFHHELGVQKPG